MEYTLDKRFRKRVYDYNQDMKNLSLHYLITKDGVCYTIDIDSMGISPYRKIGGQTFIVTEGHKILDEINENLLIDSTEIYSVLNTAKGLSDTLVVQDDKVGIMKNDAFEKLGNIVPDSTIKFKDVESRQNILKKIDEIKDKIYWLNEDDMNELINTKKHKSINIDGMYFRIFKGTLSHIRKTDKVGIYMERIAGSKYEQMIDVFLFCQRDSFLSVHRYKAVDFKG